MLLNSRKWTLVDWVITVAALPHEIFHYALARLLGLRARIGPAVTRIERGPLWKNLAVCLAPAPTGFIILLGSLWLSFIAPGRFQVWLQIGSLNGVLWLAACAFDFRDAWRMWRSRHQWEEALAGPPPVLLRWQQGGYSQATTYDPKASNQ